MDDKNNQINFLSPQVNFTKVLSTIGLILIAAVGIIGAVLIFLNSKGAFNFTPEDSSTKVATNSAKNATSSAAKDETADWKTYRSDKWRFMVKFPKEWLDPIEQSDYTLLSNLEGGDPAFVGVYFSVSNVTEINNEYTKIKSQGINQKVDGITRLQNSTIDGHANIIYKTDPAPTENGLIQSLEYGLYVSANNKVYKIYMVSGKNVTSPQKLFDQIVSTFKFL